CARAPYDYGNYGGWYFDLW
nr:immunoglobulin heavy chain junction region [Macaca mulatta]MOV35981.1 immunoglobulin heavy chain junction region [Macaca mulatta]MOV36098.1 immunoglobulin heavy chain junction region [Macaca mulatta]